MCPIWTHLDHYISVWEDRSGGRSRDRSAKFELILTTRCQYWGVDVPNLNSSWPLDVSTVGGRSGGRSRGRSAKFELILTTRCQYWEGRPSGRSRGRSAKFELILTTRCKYWGVDVPNLNSSWPLDVSTVGVVDLVADLGVDLPNVNSSWPLDVSTREG